ncbi:MAG: anaerobic ribonucleoside-triphosphate reductase, partial [Minisyncoccales bacterium]
IHDLSILGAYCVGWDLKDLLTTGFTGVPGKVSSKPAKHLKTALGQLVNFFYTLQGETAGAQAVSNFDTLLAPFIRYDNLTYKQVKQAMQEFLFNMAVPTRVGFQSPFTNITLDLKIPEYMKDEPVIINGKPQKETYKEFEKEVKMINKAFAECMMEGDANGMLFTFPIPTYNITKDFDWNNPEYDLIWEMTAKYGIPYFSNFVNSDMNPEDARSMCPLSADEKVLIKSSRGRNFEYSDIRNLSQNKRKNNEYEIYSNGKFVKGKFSEYKNQEMIKVVLKNNHEIKMSKEHLNFVIQEFNGKEVILKGKQLQPGMYLPYSLKKYKGKGGDKELGYFVGAYAGDGSFDEEGSVVFSLENKYKKHVIEKIQKIAEKYFGAHSVVKEHKKSKLVTLKIHSSAAVGLCKDFVKEKQREKHYKPRLFSTSIEFRENVLKGHYDTDGGNRNRIYTSSKKMVETLNMLAATLGTATSISKDKRNNRYGTETNYSVLIYQLNRKNYGKLWFKKNNKLWLQIKEIKEIKNSTAYCFEVKDNKPEFTIGTTGILTHNCRLRLDQDQLRKRGGGLFGANPQTGSIGVVTINMPRIGFTAVNKQEFFVKIERLMELAKESLEIKRKTIERFTKTGLYPYSKFYLRHVYQRFGEYWKNHFATIGLLGMNEAIMNFMPGENIATSRGKEFAEEIMDFMRNKLEEFQKETGNMYNLEATPGEGTSYKFARKDKKRFGRIIVANENNVQQKNSPPYYTNSTQLPVNYTSDLFKALELQDNLQCKYTGGCIEKGNKVLTNKGLMKIEEIVNNFNKLKPIKALSYNSKKNKSEWDEIIDAMFINVKKKNKIRIRAERNFDITTSDWHPFFVLEKNKPESTCPICNKKIKNIKSFAVHLKNNKKCKKEYEKTEKYKVIERRADELKKGDYLLQNTDNLYSDKKNKLNNDLMWLIGFYMGDGCISRFIDNRGGNNIEKYILRFHSEHKEPLEKTKKILNKYFNCNTNIIKNDKRSKKLKEVTTSKKEVINFFFKYGFKSGKKVYNIKVPQKVKSNLTKQNVFSLLSGLSDSDGHLSRKTGEFEYYTVSSELANDIIEIFTQAGILINKKEKLSKRKNEKTIYRIRIPKYQLTKLKENLSCSVNPLRINSEISNRKKRYLPVIRVKSTTKTNVKNNEFCDLTTKKNNNYLAGDNSFVFIHNTVFHSFIGEKLEKQGVKKLVKKISENFHLPYFTLSPTFSICPIHGYIPGEHKYCPKCDAEKGIINKQEDNKIEDNSNQKNQLSQSIIKGGE